MNYKDYLKLEQMLSLQHPLSEGPEHDELLFIVIHQVYELWFKVVIDETRSLQHCLNLSDHLTARDRLRRLRTILKTLVTQVDILETMTPLSFHSFRDRLSTASGFQSLQFRLFECILGSKERKYLEYFRNDEEGYQRLEAAMREPSVYDSFLSFLSKQGHFIPETVLKRDMAQPYTSNTEVQETLISIYKNHPGLAQISEYLVDLDEGLQEWRYRHMKMVERTIGFKMGTGGSSGAEYLKSTLFKPVFPDLWAIRSML